VRRDSVPSFGFHIPAKGFGESTEGEADLLGLCGEGRAAGLFVKSPPGLRRRAGESAREIVHAMGIGIPRQVSR